jgi:hypothetical protein
VAAARDAVDGLLRHRILRRSSADVTTEMSLRSARASAALDGFDVPLEEFRSGLESSELPPECLGAARLYAELGTMLPAWEKAPRQVLARMHVLAARGMEDDALLGRPRDGLVAPANPLRLGAAPSPLEVSVRLDGLTEQLVRPTTAPAVVVAAIVQAELLVLQSFGVADGLVARAAGRLCLIGRGLDPKAVTSSEVGHVELGSQYPQAVAGYRDGGPAGVAAWVIHCAQAVELGARESRALCEALQRAA